MNRRPALLAATATLALAAGPAVTTAGAATAPAAAKSAGIAFQHALGKGQTAKACGLLTTSAVKNIASQVQKPSSTSCSSLLPAYVTYLKKLAGVSAKKLGAATYKSAQAQGSGWYITTSAATSVVTKSHGTWKVSVPVALG